MPAVIGESIFRCRDLPAEQLCPIDLFREPYLSKSSIKVYNIFHRYACYIRNFIYIAACKNQYTNIRGHMGIIVKGKKDIMYLIFAGTPPGHDSRIGIAAMSYFTDRYKMVIRRYVGKE